MGEKPEQNRKEIRRLRGKLGAREKRNPQIMWIPRRMRERRNPQITQIARRTRK
jgi:hypothetical protein